MTAERVRFLVVRVGRRIGLVERWAVERTVAWGLGESPVSIIACLDVPVLNRDAPEIRLRRRLLREPRVLVGAPGRWLGVAESRLSPPMPRLATAELSRAPAPFRRFLEVAGRVGDEENVRVALVGGAVRDLFLGARDVDIDLVVEGDGPAFARRLGHRLRAKVTSHPRFLTARLTLPDGRIVDVAGARQEGYPVPGCLPRIEPGTLLDDLKRRDFTINAMAVRLNRPFHGRVEDPLGGREDLRRRRLRVLHPLSFIEDPSRAFRAARYAVRYRLRLTPGSRHLLRQAMRLDLYDPQAFRRLGTELGLIIREADPPAVFRALGRLGALQLLSPATRPRQELLSSVEAALTWYARVNGVAVRFALSLYLLALTQRLADAEVTALLDRLGLANVKRQVEESRRTAPAILRVASHGGSRSSRIALGLRPFSEPSVLWAWVRARGALRLTLRRYLERLRGVRAALSGDDLRRMGVPPGPVYRQILDSLLEARLDGRVASRREEVALVRHLLRVGPAR